MPNKNKRSKTTKFAIKITIVAISDMAVLARLWRAYTRLVAVLDTIPPKNPSKGAPCFSFTNCKLVSYSRDFQFSYKDSSLPTYTISFSYEGYKKTYNDFGTESSNSSDIFDDNRYNILNYFKTKDEAQQYADKIKDLLKNREYDK